MKKNDAVSWKYLPKVKFQTKIAPEQVLAKAWDTAAYPRARVKVVWVFRAMLSR